MKELSGSDQADRERRDLIRRFSSPRLRLRRLIWPFRRLFWTVAILATRGGKRLLDILISALLLILSSPFVLLILAYAGRRTQQINRQ